MWFSSKYSIQSKYFVITIAASFCIESCVHSNRYRENDGRVLGQPANSDSGLSYIPSTSARLNPAKARELDNYLSSVMNLKVDVEKKARHLKMRLANDVARSDEAKIRYHHVVQSLGELKERVKQDFTDHSGRTSYATNLAAENFMEAGNQYRFFYSDMVGSADKSFWMVALSGLEQLMSLWSVYGQSEQRAYHYEIDQRLTPVSWQNLSPSFQPNFSF
jgi:hypothetical protein